MNKNSPPVSRLLSLTARLSLASLLGLAGCDRQLATPQDSFTVSLEQAQQVAEHLANTNVAAHVTGLTRVTNHFVLTADQRPALYVFNYTNSGFAIVPADKHLMPVVAYSATGLYTNTDKPGGLLLWEQKTAQLVADARKPGTPLPPVNVRREWTASLSTEPLSRIGNSPKPIQSKVANRPLPGNPPPQDYEVVVGPLLPVTWGQACTYNDLCRAGGSCGSHRYTGCVMTSMAQIMAYWRYPATYNWAAMPANIGNRDVQQLMVDCQNNIPSLDDSSDSGTGAHLSDVAGVGVLGHNLSPAAGFKSAKFGYSSADFITYDYARVMNDLNAARPAILGGCNSQTNRALGIYYTYDGCHAWVCDGYDEIHDTTNGYTYLFFHMNWGWHERFRNPGNPSDGSGDYNGWYQYNNWNISGLNRNYQYANEAIINIHP